MARIRYLKPDFFRDENISELSFEARILYQGLWCYADREGRLRYSPKRIKADIFPYDKINIEKLLDQLAAPKRENGAPFILIYEVDNQKYIQVIKFKEHQKIHIKEPESTMPAPTQHPPSTEQAPTQNPGTLMGMGMGMGKELYPSFEKDVFEKWNSFHQKFPSLPKVQEITGTRREHLKARFEKESFRDFQKILEAIEKQPFLIHGNPQSKEHKDWKVDFDWIIKNDTNYIKVLELKYLNKKVEKSNAEMLKEMQDKGLM
jgi:hypothetical protein